MDDDKHLSASELCVPSLDTKFHEVEDANIYATGHAALKVDLRILPWCAILYLLTFFWRNNIGNASFDASTPDIQLSWTQSTGYWAAFFVLAVIIPAPSNVVLETTVKAKYWISFLMLVAGAAQLGIGWARKPVHIGVAHIFLAASQAGVLPGILCLIMHWYSRFQTAFRLSLVFGPAVLIGSLSGILAYLLNLAVDGLSGQAGWRWIFTIVGVLTMAVACLSFWILPDYPGRMSTWTEDEKASFVANAWRDRPSDGGSSGIKASLSKIVRHRGFLPYLLFMIAASIPLYGYYADSAAIIAGLAGGRLSIRQQLTLAVPPYIVAVTFYIASSYYSDRLRIRGRFLLVASALSIIGYVLLISNNVAGVNYLGCFFVCSGINTMIPLAFLWGSEIQGGYMARAIASGILIGSAQIGGSISKYTLTADSPGTTSHAVDLAMSVFCTIVAAYLARTEQP